MGVRRIFARGGKAEILLI